MSTLNRLLPVCLLLLALGACYQSAPKPPGYGRISEAQADGVPPILSQAQLELLSELQLSDRITALQQTRGRAQGNPGVRAVLDDQSAAATARLKELQGGG